MRAYRWLLSLYPASFRDEYAREMTFVFAERYRREKGMRGRAAMWIEAVSDAVRNALPAHADIVRQDLLYTARMLRRSPGFFLTAVLLSALGVGVTTAVYSVADHVLLKPLPFEDAGRLVRLWEDESVRGYSRMELSPPNFRDWRQQSRSFTAMGAFTATGVNLVGNGRPERVEAGLVSGNLFALLGARAASGRVFVEADEHPGAPMPAVISHRLWLGRFGGAPIVGRSIVLSLAGFQLDGFDGQAVTIVGVMPDGFYFPTREPDVWLPLRQAGAAFEDRDNNFLHAIARLRPGVSLEQARAEMKVIAARLAIAHPKENDRTGATVLLFRDQVSNQARLLLAALAGGAACVLLIACVNLANLLLVRALSRRRELAVRAALGAGHGRLLRQLLTESLLLAAAGGVAGVCAGVAAQPLIARLVPTTLPIKVTPGLDLRVLAIAAIVTIAAGLGFGVFPALRACRNASADDLRAGGWSGPGRQVERLRSWLIVVEVGATVVLLVASGLFTRALVEVRRIDPGFDATGVLTMRTVLPMPAYAQTMRRQAFYDRVLSDVRRLPGVSSAAYISFLPMTMRGGVWRVEGTPGAKIEAAPRSALLRFVTPGFFAAAGVPVRAGRDVAPSDTREAPFVAVVSQSFAREHFPRQAVLGQRFTIAFAERTVVGVVGDVHVRGLERPSEPQVYLPSGQVPDGAVPLYAPKDLVVRASTRLEPLVPAIRAIIAKADPEQPVSDVRTLASIVDDETAPRAVQARVLGGFTGAAFLLAAVGLHGVLAFMVSGRSREIAVRLALGARPAQVRALVLRRGVILGATGAAAGLLAGYAAGRTMTALLAGVPASDIATLGGAAALALVMTLAGSAIPAWRAARVDPMTTMRAE